MNDADMDKRALLPRRVREQLVRDWNSLKPIVASIAEVVEKVSDEQLVEMIWHLRGTLACMLYRAVN